MPLSWPAWASGLAVALLFGVHTAPTPSASLTLPARPSILRADGNVVAAVVPGNRKGRCAEIVLWQVGRKPEAIRTIDECDTDGIGLDHVVELALAGRRVAWQETNGGNNLELIVSTATLAHPKQAMVSYVENGGGAATDPAGEYNGDLVGHGALLAYATWTLCDRVGGDYARPCSPGSPDVYDQALHRIGGGLLGRGSAVLDPIWTDGSAILIRHAAGTLLLVDAKGRTIRSFPALPGLTGAVFQGSRLVTLTDSALAVWSADSGARLRSFALAPRKRVLEDIDGGVAVLGANGVTHLIRLSDGHGATFGHAAHAQLEPQGLFFADGRTLRFVPRARIRLG